MGPRARRGIRAGRGRPPKQSRERSVDLERYRDFVHDWSHFVEAAGRPEPTVLRVRTGRIRPDELEERLSARGFRLRRLDGLPAFLQVEDSPYPVSLTIEHWLGLVYVQQASTGVVAPALGAAPGERVLDLCAAPGGKTTHIAELMQDRGCLVASEISESRIRGLLGNVYRLGHPNVLVVAGDGRAFPEGPLFDRVLVDAPCSGEGTLRRRGGRAPNQSRSFTGFVTLAQRALLEKAVRLTRPGGVVVYVTCTFAPEENEAVVSDALGRLPVEIEPLELPVPHARGLTSFESDRYDARVEGAARLYPHHLDSGGLFLAKLRRLDGEVPERQGSWSPVPSVFPSEDSLRDGGAPTAADAIHHREAAEEQIRHGLDEVCERFGIERDLGDVGWTMRGARAWLHTVGEWPLEAWGEGRWRPVSIGLRALEFDSRGRPRPTNDFLRWVGADAGMVDLTADELRVLLRREAIPTGVERRGPIALGHRGDVVGRGAVTGAGLKSEIPKARANDLLRILGVGEGERPP